MDTEKNSMMLPAFLGVGGVIVIALVLFLFVHQNTVKYKVDLDTYVSDQPLSATFKCADGTRFIAEFPASGELRVVMDGKPKQIFPSLYGSKNHFKDNLFKYDFVHEEVSVTTLHSGKTLKCNEEVYLGRGPVNFGDTGEGGGHQIDMDLIHAVEANILGKWQSADGKKYEFTKGGTILDTTNGPSIVAYGWAVLVQGVFSKTNFTLDPGVPYLQIYDNHPIAGLSHKSYKIIKLTPEELELVGMEGEADIFFRKVQ